MAVKANKGVSIEAIEAVHSWGSIELPPRDDGDVPKVNIVRISHMCYGHPDTNRIKTFLLDFGMQIVKETPTKIWFGGYGKDPYVYVVVKTKIKEFLGASYIVETFADLER